MITEFSICNFKAFDSPAAVEIKPVTLLYGANSAGKSSLLQGMLLLKQSLTRGRLILEDSSLDFRGPYIDLGGFGAAIRDHNLSNSMTFTLSIQPSRGTVMTRSGPFSRGARLELEFAYETGGRKTFLKSLQLDFADQSIRFRHMRRRDREGIFPEGIADTRLLVELWLNQAPERRPSARTATRIAALDSSDITWIAEWLMRSPMSSSTYLPIWEPSLLRGSGRPVGGSLNSPRREALFDFLYEWQLWISRLQVSVSNSLERVKYVGPLREAPQRINVEVSTGSKELGSRGERALRLLSRDPDLLARLNAAFKDMEIPYEANISTLRSDDDNHSLGDVNVLTLRELKTGLVTTLSDVGFGVSQVVPVLLQLLINEQSIILIEQPELHLHPKLQARLADVIAASIRLRRNKVLIETHSEHLLTRLQRRCREKEFLTPQMLNIIYVDARDEQNPLSQIRLGDDGEMMDPWPAGFFDDQLSDLFGGVEELALLPEG